LARTGDSSIQPGGSTLESHPVSNYVPQEALEFKARAKGSPANQRARRLRPGRDVTRLSQEKVIARISD